MHSQALGRQFQPQLSSGDRRRAYRPRKAYNKSNDEVMVKHDEPKIWSLAIAYMLLGRRDCLLCFDRYFWDSKMDIIH
ncbi:hypothetical protein L596_012409 [Steinernema carpocapsae]|uniref:Uncharacterized protein n=1 Tax=Steinernema carpocapsae TaxID=34508 RepID=A0A4U5NX00_STECR|nr:hypothetical protein L596_012409 [Steinernema carpocapsae]